MAIGYTPLDETNFRKDLTREMNNECKSKHPDKAWFCEGDAFHRGKPLYLRGLGF